MVTKLEGLSISAILLLIASFIQVGDTSLEPNYACAIKEIKAYCYDLSSSGITCYTQPGRTGGKQCRGGVWEEIPIKEESIEEEPTIQTPVTSTPTGNRHHYRSTGCIDCI